MEKTPPRARREGAPRWASELRGGSKQRRRRPAGASEGSRRGYGKSGSLPDLQALAAPDWSGREGIPSSPQEKSLSSEQIDGSLFWGESWKIKLDGNGARGWRAMRLQPAPLWLLGAVLGASLRGGCCGSLSHSLCYSYLHLPEPSKGLPQFFIRSYLDDQPITRFDSLTWKTEPLVPWMEKAETFRAPRWIFRADLEKLSKLDHRVGGLHTWQAILGCELREDGSKGGFFHYGYDGMDFISFDKETLRWVAAQPQAQKVKEEWEEDPGRSQRSKVFLEKACIEWLLRYLSYKKEAPQRTEPPVGKVTQKVVDDSLDVLTCQAFGFYPKEIQATWTRDGENWEQEILHRNVAPNSDGTYYIWLIIEIDPKDRDHFRCRLEHEGLQGPLILSLKEKTATIWWIPLAIVAAIILALVILFLSYCRWRGRKILHQEETTCPDQLSVEMLPSPPRAEAEIQW